MDERRNKIIVGSTIVIVLLVITAAVLWKSSYSCEFVQSAPLAGNLSHLTNISDLIGHKSLAAFDGYIRYLEHPKANATYLTLGLESVSFNNETNGKNSTLTLATDCAKIDLIISAPSWPSVSVSSINIEWNSPNKDDDKCIIEEPHIYSSAGKHYCRDQFSEQNYRCETKSNATIYLVVNKLEFEINGNPENVKKGKYSTPGTGC